MSENEKWYPISTAPQGEQLLVWGNGGTRFGVKDPNGQWRARHGGALRDAPRLWRYIPQPSLQERRG